MPSGANLMQSIMLFYLQGCIEESSESAGNVEVHAAGKRSMSRSRKANLLREKRAKGGDVTNDYGHSWLSSLS